MEIMKDRYFNAYYVWKNLEKIIDDIGKGRYDRAIFGCVYGLVVLKNVVRSQRL